MSVYSFLSLFPISFPCPLVVMMMMRVVVVVVVVSTCMHTWAWSSTRSPPAQHAPAHESCTQPCGSCMNPAPSASAFTRLHLSLHPILHLQIPCRPPVSCRVVCVYTPRRNPHPHPHPLGVPEPSVSLNVSVSKSASVLLPPSPS
jgi:hypothetical protein